MVLYKHSLTLLADGEISCLASCWSPTHAVRLSNL